MFLEFLKILFYTFIILGRIDVLLWQLQEYLFWNKSNACRISTLLEFFFTKFWEIIKYSFYDISPIGKRFVAIRTSVTT